MIRVVEVKGYKCLRYIRQELDSFQILVGPNASGKSTFLDAVLFVRDLLIKGVEGAVRDRARTVRELSWKGEHAAFEIAVEFALPKGVTKSGNGQPHYPYARYELRIVGESPEGIQIALENLWLLSQAVKNKQPHADAVQRTLFPVEPQPPETIVVEPGKHTPSGWRKVVSRNPEGRVYIRSEKTKWNIALKPRLGRTGLTIVPEEEERFPATVWLRRLLSERIQFLMLNSRAMRAPCPPDVPRTFQSDGSNLALVVETLREEHFEQFQWWLGHVQTVLSDIRDVEVRKREEDNFRYIVAVLNDGTKIPSWLLSDGTLRFLALTLIAYLPESGVVYFIEEPENGIHPKALEAMYQSLSSLYEGQIFCATHSPVFLNLAKPKELLCFARAESGATDIVRGDAHPWLKEWREAVTLGDLLASGVLG